MRALTVGIVDYGVGNHASVWRALHALGYRCRVSSEPEVLSDTDLLLLPGVGAFPPAMAEAFLPHPAMAASFTAELTEAEMDAYVAAFFKPGDADLPAIFKADIRRTDGQARSGLGSSIRPDGYRDVVEAAARLTVPLAILHGEQEQLVNAAYFRALTMPTLWRGAVQVIPGAGHAPHWEQPERFNALLQTFIQECVR